MSREREDWHKVFYIGSNQKTLCLVVNLSKEGLT